MKIKINNKQFFFFNKFIIQRNLDSVASSFSFLANFNTENNDHKELFKPLSFQDIEIFDNEDKLLLTGTLVNFNFNSTSKPHLVKVSGYSKAGVLEDSNIPHSAYPLESINRSLEDISTRLLNIFGINLIIDDSVKPDAALIYPKSIASPTSP